MAKIMAKTEVARLRQDRTTVRPPGTPTRPPTSHDIIPTPASQPLLFMSTYEWKDNGPEVWARIKYRAARRQF